MPRTHNSGASTLRSRNRVTNKTRLKVVRGDFHDDPDVWADGAVLGQSDSQLAFGLDAEDATEHHLQAVLSASQSTARATRNESAEKKAAPAAYIPVPDSTGIVDDYEKLYPQRKWTDPVTYIKSSESVDEVTANALNEGFTYYMDERDKDWLDKNNEEARGEGTSAQGAVSSTNGTSTRSTSGSRSAKAKGKEPDVTQAVTITEDEFELVMGLFERITHDKTEFLHHGLENGMTFPSFAEYQDSFSSPLSNTLFAAYVVPTWIPEPTQLLRIARVVYPHWKERRIERGGHRIIPQLNGDEVDTLNESYICFRRREIKAVRKTRASQVTFTDKLIRLQSELSQSLELAKVVLARESIKRDSAHQAQSVWEKRLAVVDLKRKFSSLGDKADEELLYDKEKVKKLKIDSRLPGLKLLRNGHVEAGSPLEASIKPKERTALIAAQVDREILKAKERDHHWDDAVDNAYQPSPVPHSSRLFKYIPRTDSRYFPSSDTSSDAEEPQRQPRSVRLRFGRGGRLLLDRGRSRTATLPSWSSQSHKREDAGDDSDEERIRRLAERWKFDSDDYPPVGPEGPDELDRVLVDDFDSKYMRHTMQLLQEQEQSVLQTDATITLFTAEGRHQTVVPFKLGQQPSRSQLGVRAFPAGVQPTSVSAQQPAIPLSMPMANGNPLVIASQMKKLATPIRISSNGGMRPPGTPMMAANGLAVQTSPSHGSSASTVNGTHQPSNRSDPVSAEPLGAAALINGAPMPVESAAATVTADVNGSPVRPKSQQAHAVALSNGYHVGAINGFNNGSTTSQYLQHANGQAVHGLSIQQMHNLKSTFAAMPTQQDMNVLVAQAGSAPVNGRGVQQAYLPHTLPNSGFSMQGTGMNLKLPPARQVQWAGAHQQQQRVAAAMNGIGDVTMSAPSMSLSPSIANAALPVRTPSANGTRTGLRVGSANGVGHMLAAAAAGNVGLSPLLQHQQLQASVQTSPRLAMGNVAGVIQQGMPQQPVVGSTQGY